MPYKNRTLSYTFAGTMTGNAQVAQPMGFSPDRSMGLFTIEVGGFCRFSCAWTGLSATGGPQLELRINWFHSYITDAGPGFAVDVRDYAGPPTVVYDLTGNYTVTIQLDENVTFSNGATISPDLLDEYPSDIAAVLEAVAKNGGTVTASATYGTNSVSDTATVFAPNIPITSNQVVILDIFDNANHTGALVPAYVTVTPTWNGVGISAPGGSETVSGVTIRWGSTCSVRAPGDHEGRLVFDVAATTRYDVQGVVKAFDQPYAGSLVVRCTTKQNPDLSIATVDMPVGGSFSTSITQDTWGVTPSVDGSVIAGYPKGLNERCPIGCWLTYASLIAAGQDGDLALRKLWMRTWHWNAATIRQAASIDAISGSWTAVGAGGSITVLAAAFDGRLRGTSWVGASLGGYAFADVFLTADMAGQPARINLGLKFWDVTVGTAGSVRIDLCSPTSYHVDSDLVDSQYPLIGSGLYTATEGWSAGVRNTPGVIVDHLAAGRTYTLTKITLLRTNHSRITFLDSFKNWRRVQYPVTIGMVTGTTYYRMARQGDTDGVQSLEQTDYSRQVNSGGSTSDTVSAQDIKTFVRVTNGTSGAYPTDGWTAADLQVTDGSSNIANGLLNSDQASTVLFGAGAYYDGSAWTSGVNKDASGTLTIPANILINSIIVYPGCGDPFFGGGAGVATPLRPAIILEGGAWGLVFNSSGARTVGAVVTARDHITHVSGGSGTTDAQGEYQTGSPFIRGLSNADVGASGASYNLPFYTRYRRRLVPGTAFGNPYNAHHDAWGFYLRACTQAGSVAFSMSNYPIPLGAAFDISNVMVTNTGQDSDPRIAYDRTGAQRLIAVFCRTISGTPQVMQAISTDEGATWTVPTILIASAKHPAIAVGHDGTIIVAAYTGAAGGPGTISATVQATGDASPSAVFVLKDGAGTNLSVNDDTFGISQGRDGAHRWILACVITGDSGISEWYSTDWDGRTWTRVV